MLAKLRAARQIYQEETRFDWLVLAADAVGVIVVVLAFMHARSGDTAVDAVIQIASAGF